MRMNVKMNGGPFSIAEVIPYVVGSSVSIDILNVPGENTLLGIVAAVKNHMKSMPVRSTYVVRFPNICNNLVIRLQVKRNYIDEDGTFDDYLCVIMFRMYLFILNYNCRNEESDKIVNNLKEIGDNISEKVISSITAEVV